MATCLVKHVSHFCCRFREPIFSAFGAIGHMAWQDVDWRCFRGGRLKSILLFISKMSTAEFYRKGIVSFGALELQHWLYLNIVESGRYWYFMIFFDCSCLFCRSRRRMPGLQSTKLESATEYALRVNQMPYNQRASVADYSGVPMNQCPQGPGSNFGNPRKTARRRWGPLNILASGPQRSLIRH